MATKQGTANERKLRRQLAVERAAVASLRKTICACTDAMALACGRALKDLYGIDRMFAVLEAATALVDARRAYLREVEASVSLESCDPLIVAIDDAHKRLSDAVDAFRNAKPKPASDTP